MHVYTKFRLDATISVSYTPICVPIIIYGLRLFIVVLQELHRIVILLHGCYGYLSVRKVSFLNSIWLLRCVRLMKTTLKQLSLLMCG